MIWLSMVAAIALTAVAVIIFIVQSNRKKQKNFEQLKEELKKTAKKKDAVAKTSSAATTTAVSKAKETVEAESADLLERSVEVVSPPKSVSVEESTPVKAAEVRPEHKLKHYEKFNNMRAVEQLGLSQEEADMFVKELIEQIDEELPKLEAAIEKKEFEQIDDISHMIKGSSASLGSGGVADLLTEMNEYCKKGRDIEIIKEYLYNL